MKGNDIEVEVRIVDPKSLSQQDRLSYVTHPRGS